MVTSNKTGQVTPFGNPRINTRSPTPQGISQATTSFISSRHQGIHQTLTKTKNQTPKNTDTKQKQMLATTIQITNNPTTTNPNHPQKQPKPEEARPTNTLTKNPTARPTQTNQQASPDRLMSHPTTKNKILRKEVIQPHLPVRLPCYDFVPIANPTFDHSQKAMSFGCYQLS